MISLYNRRLSFSSSPIFLLSISENIAIIPVVAFVVSITIIFGEYRDDIYKYIEINRFFDAILRLKIVNKISFESFQHIFISDRLTVFYRISVDGIDGSLSMIPL